MKSLLFIGHSHHSLTQSSSFFKDCLKNTYHLTELSLDPSDEITNNTSKLTSIDFGQYSGIVLWQIDYLASFFLARGIPVIVCPMYDSSSSLEPNHWRAIKKSLIICFSLELQYLLAKAGVDSLYARYFPELASNHQALLADSEHLDRSPLRVFFWERLPDTEINQKTVLHSLEGLDLGSFHIHQAADPGRKPSAIDAEAMECTISSSSWFSSKSDYLRMLDNADIFVAPRYAEGIGLSFLEAMAHGCCVIAHDMPTHNEYISNWRNGILVDYSDPNIRIQASAVDIRSIGRTALINSELLCANWKEFYCPLVLDSIANYLDNFNAHSSLLPQSDRGILLELESLCAAHSDWDTYYDHINIISHPEAIVTLKKNTKIMPIINKLVHYGRISDAIRLLDSAIERDGASNSIYFLIRQQLQDQARLKSSSTLKSSKP